MCRVGFAVVSRETCVRSKNNSRRHEEIVKGTNMSFVVLCDFDGTAVTIDTSVFILQRFAAAEWRVFDEQFEKGELKWLFLEIRQEVKEQIFLFGSCDTE